jgi:hypothetical protein
MEKNITISKLDAARRQLETVIRLYFSNDDPVSIHTLSAAAYSVIRDINKKRGGTPMMVKDTFAEYIKPEHKKMVMDKVNAAENFFKHADRDHEDSLEFNPELSEILIVDACSKYTTLTGEDPPLFKLYRGWYMANHQNIFILPEEQKELLKLNAPFAINLGRAVYSKLVLPMLMSTNS